MRFTVADDDGSEVEFACAETIISRWVCGDILAGKTYPILAFVDDVRIVFDVGANCGAASVFLARHYPDAEVHAFEPGSEARGILERNAAEYSNIRVHPIGLHSVDQVVPLYRSDVDTGMGSVFRRDVNLGESEPVQLRSAGAWAREHGIDRIDVLKVDVEGCEVDVLESLEGLLPTVKVLYVEYDSRKARQEIEKLVDASHELFTAVVFLDQGECVYLRKDLAELDAATACVQEYIRVRWSEGIEAR